MTPAPVAPPASNAPSSRARIALPVSIAMLVAWAVWTFAFDPAPGAVHLLLTFGVFLLIWSIVARDETAAPVPPSGRSGRR